MLLLKHTKESVVNQLPENVIPLYSKPYEGFPFRRCRIF
jgi:hypothetical protein